MSISRCLTVVIAVIFLAAPVAATAAPSSAEAASEMAYEKSFLESLHPQRGTVTLPDAEAELQLGDKYYFLDKDDARKVIVEAWHNPPSAAEDVLGMVVPAGRTVFNDWGAIVTYEKTDYISDKDADSTDYDQFVKDIQDGEADTNATRQKAGYEPIHLVGWAQPPSYDHASHTMIWARDIKFGTSEVDTLNYDIRLLGRSGVLSLNMIASVPELADIREQAKQLALSGQFQAGSRYDDYKQGDPKAAYGVAGLVAAGLGLAAAKKLGLLALLLVFMKKGFVFIAAGAAAIARWGKGLFGGLFGKKPSTRSNGRSPFENPPPEGNAADEVSRLAGPQSPTIEDVAPERKNLD